MVLLQVPYATTLEPMALRPFFNGIAIGIQVSIFSQPEHNLFCGFNKLKASVISCNCYAAALVDITEISRNVKTSSVQDGFGFNLFILHGWNQGMH